MKDTNTAVRESRDRILHAFFEIKAELSVIVEHSESFTSEEVALARRLLELAENCDWKLK